MTLFITPYHTCCDCHHFKYKILANTIRKSSCRKSTAIAVLIIKISSSNVISIAININISTTDAIAINITRIFNIKILVGIDIIKAQPSPQCQSSVSRATCRNHIGAIHDHHCVYWYTILVLFELQVQSLHRSSFHSLIIRIIAIVIPINTQLSTFIF